MDHLPIWPHPINHHHHIDFLWIIHPPNDYLPMNHRPMHHLLIDNLPINHHPINYLPIHTSYPN